MQNTSNPAGAGVVLEPARRFEMPRNIDGWYTPPTLRFSESGDALTAAQQVHGYGALGWLAWHAPTLGLGAAALGVVMGAVAVVRVWRRPQRRGQFYCRRCNYDLTGPGGMPPGSGPDARCPECGVALDRRPARLGRTAGARVWGWLLAGAAAALLGAAAVTATVKAGGMAWEPAWMPRATSALGLAPLYRREGVLEGVAQPTVLRRWELPGPGEAGGVVRRVWPGVLAFSGDGAHAVFAQLGGAAPGEVRVLRLADGEEFGINLGNTTFPQGAACPSRDPARVYVPCTLAGTFNSTAFEQQAWRVDLHTREAALVGSISVEHGQGAANPGITVMPAMREVEGELVWCVLVVRAGAAGPVAAEVLLPGGRSFPLPIAGNAGQPVLSPDGRRLVCIDHGRAGPFEVELSLEDGAVARRPVASTWMSDESRGGLRAVVVPTGAAAGIDVVDRAGRVVASLAMPPGWGAGGPVAVSADGRWCAASCSRTTTDWLGDPRMESEVVVWDLSELGVGAGG